VEAFEAGRAYRRVLDLGCGSGILALAAARLFEDAPVLAIDLDPEATATTDENVALNALEPRISTVTGTVDEVEATRFDLVVANIRTEVLVPAAATISQRVGRSLLLSGILREEADEVADAYAATGLVERGRATLGDWVGLHFERGDG
jgi:ribosomal protein L11 methyltransferase